jgi:hypothetical protein
VVRECYVAHCRLPWNGPKPLWISAIITRCWTLIYWPIWQWYVSWKLNITGCMLYNIFGLFVTRNHSMESLCMSFVSLCMYKTDHSKSCFMMSEWESRFQLKWVLFWYTDGSKTKEEWISMAQGRSIASALDIAPWFSKLKCMPLRHAQLII